MRAQLVSFSDGITPESEALMKAKVKAFSHLDLGLSVGAPGIGVELSAPLSDNMRLRSGLSFMPRMEVPMRFAIQVGDDANASKSKFEKLSGLLTSMTGYEVDDAIDMIGKPTYWNWNVMFDVFPLKDKHWHLTAGFFLGPSKIAKAYNVTEDMPSLMAVGIYNNMYKKLVNDETLSNPMARYGVQLIDLSALGDKYKDITLDPETIDLLFDAFKSAGRMGIHVGDYTHDVLYDEDVYMTKTETDEYGDPVETKTLLHAKGDVKYPAGSPYMMEPDGDSMAKAAIFVNSFKPYLGVGYSGRLLKNSDRYLVSFDCGAMFWGGTPSIKTHDGTDLAKDVTNIEGKVGDYVKGIKGFKVMPVFNLRISYRLF
jgi:hypothetical protein